MNLLKSARQMITFKEKNLILGTNIAHNDLLRKIEQCNMLLKKERKTQVRMIVEDKGPFSHSVEELMKYAENNVLSKINSDLYLKIDPPIKKREPNSVSYLIYPRTRLSSCNSEE